jgi:hypothetical protein
MTSSCGARLAARVALVALLLSGIGARGLAKVALSGRVVDETGGPLPAATVSVRKLSGEQFYQSSQTDSQGHYSFPELPDGEYSVEGALTGFVSVLYKPVRIYFPAEVRWDFVLSVAGFGGDAVYASSELVGELLWRGVRMPTASICVTRADEPPHPTCTVTNRLGQYFLDLPPAIYIVSIDCGRGLQAKDRLDLRTAGQYRNKITPPGAQ